MKKIFFLLLSAVSFLISEVALAQAIRAYSVTVINPNQVGHISGAAFNNRGEVVYNQIISQHDYVFLYSNGQLQIISNPNGSFIAATDINNSGTVIGNRLVSGSIGTRGFSWTNGAFSNVGSEYALTKSINDAEQIVGSHFPNGSQLPFLFSHSLFTTLPVGAWGLANDINNSGAVVGYGSISGAYADRRGYVYKQGSVQWIPPLTGFGHNFSEANIINNNETVLGISGRNDSYGSWVGFIWNSSQGARPLNQHLNVSGELIGVAINNRGDIVGTGRWYDNSTIQSSGSFISFSQSKPILLDKIVTPSNRYTLNPIGINDSGTVLSYCRLNSDPNTVEYNKLCLLKPSKAPLREF